ncbi:MAG TPA: FHA domain-containing protein, partial [Anaerolineae bacterium]
RSRSRVEVRVVEPELDRKHFQAPASDHSQVIIPQVEPSRPSIVQEPQQSPAGRAMATLIAREPSNLQFQARISSMRYTIGRRDDNDGAIHLDSQSGVSGSHAVIISEGGTWYVQDSNSTNGTFVNGKKLPANGRMRLDDHTVIGLGPKVKLEFRIQS